jgi:DNA-directed RNA polymerase specialized sigma24 family protein
MENYAPPTDDQGWIEIINRLRAFAEDQISIYSWFRGENSLPQGYTAEDFTQETILRYCENPSIYDPARGKFLAFLKYSVLRRLVYNLSELAENAQTKDIYPISSEEDENDGLSYEDYLPGTILDIESQIDHDT